MAFIPQSEHHNWTKWEVQNLARQNFESSSYYWFEHLDSEWWYSFGEYEWPRLTYIIVAFYWMGILYYKQFMKDRKPLSSLKSVLTILFAINAIFGIGCTIRTFPRMVDSLSRADGFYNVFCVRNGDLNFDFFWVIMYHWSKLWQLAETILIILLKKKLTLLHVVHHSTMACMSAAISLYGEPLMYAIFFLNVLQHSLTYPILILKMYNVKLWKGANAFTLLLEMGVVATGVIGSVYTQFVMRNGGECVRHPRSIIIFNIGIWSILLLVAHMLYVEISKKTSKANKSE